MRATTTLLVAAALCACHSDDSTDAISANSPSDLLVSIAQLDCQEAFSCEPTYPGDDFISDYGGSVGECVQDDVDVDDLQTIEDDVADGLIDYDAEVGAECLNQITYSDCVTYWDDGTDLPDSCDNVFAGTVPDGGPCNVDFDCASLISGCDASTFTCSPDAGDVVAARRRTIRRLLHR